jgi:uncharacterized membrane protein (DUF373 family)
MHLLSEALPARPRRSRREALRERVAQTFTLVEDVVYVGLGILLAASAITLLVSLVLAFGQNLFAGTLAASIVSLLDQVLLTLMIVELLYTVQVSFREHVLVPEPFILVGLIAAIRRILVLTAEIGKLLEKDDGSFQHAMVELGVLTLMTLTLVGSLIILRKRRPDAVAERA